MSRCAVGVMTGWVVVASLAVGCDKERATPRPGSGAVGSAKASAATAANTVEPLAARPDPCAFVAAQQVTAVVGDLVDAPRRGRSFDHSEAAANGNACVYTVKAPALGELVPTLSVEVRSDGVARELGFRIGAHIGRNLARQLGWSSPDGADPNASAGDGWDYRAAWPSEYFGRLGSLGISIGIEGFEKTPWEAIGQLAALVRDAVPDRPMASTSDDGHSREADPCGLLTAADVEAAAGTLTFLPYRSEDDTRGIL